MKLNSTLNLKFKAPAVLSTLLLLVIILELCAVYFFWLQYLKVEVPPVSTDSVVKVNLPGYRSTIQFLDKLNQFAPGAGADTSLDSVNDPQNGAGSRAVGEVSNPFIYR